MKEKKLTESELKLMLLTRQAGSEIITWWCELKSYEIEGPLAYFQRIQSMRNNCLALGIDAFKEEAEEFVLYLLDPKMLHEKFSSAVGRLVVLNNQLKEELENVHPLSEVADRLIQRINGSYKLTQMIIFYLNQNNFDEEA